MRATLALSFLLQLLLVLPSATGAATNSIESLADYPTGAGVAPRASANGEQFEGVWSDPARNIAEFRGIPFAAPPTGPLRWRAPRTHQPREGVQQATKFAPACMQGSGIVDWYAGVATAFGQGPEVVSRPEGINEDCLYLNVWTPDLRPGADLPVMVYVHGGSNSGGWSYEPNYQGSALARRGVVVVTIAYRLGPFGFFAHPALPEEPGEAPANFALLDIRHGFEWVQRNIRSFGGDPRNITAFGESAGALNLIDLMVQDAAAGRLESSPYRRLIVQSLGGSLSVRQNLVAERALGEALIRSLGPAGSESARGLREIPAEQLLAAAEKLPPDHYHDAVIDDRTLTATPWELALGADLAGVDIILGTNADEWLMYIAEDAGQEELADRAAEAVPGDTNRILDLLPPGESPRKALDRLETAHNMLCPSRALATLVNRRGGRAWMYFFNRQRNGPGGEALGSYHGAELPYVFDTHDAWLTTETADHALTAKMMDFWVQFARTGNPNQDGLPHWPRFAAAEASVMKLDEPVAVVPPHDQRLCELLGTARSGPESGE